MKKLMTRILTVVLTAALVLGASGVRTYAATSDSPEYINELIDMVFSVKKPTINSSDKTINGNGFDGKPLKDYYQIHDYDNLSKTGDPGRYAVAVSGPAVSAAIDDVLNAYTGTENYSGTHNINETDVLSGNGDQSKLAEEVLKAVLGEDLYASVNVLADAYIREQLQISVKQNQSAIVDIDWYVVKHQSDNRVGGRYHVDGNVTVTIKEYEDWTVAYNFQQAYGSEEYDRVALEKKITVEKDTMPVFPDENNTILDPSAVDQKYEDAKYTLKVNEDGIAVIEFTENKTIEIYYDVAEPEIEYVAWTVTYTFVNGEESNSITLEEKIENIVDGERPEFDAEKGIKTPNDVNNELKNEEWTLKTENNVPVIVFHDNDRDIEITYVKVEKQPEKEPEKEPEQSVDPVDPQDPTEPQNPSDEPEKKNDPVVPFIIIPPVITETPEEPVVEEIPVTEPETPEGTPVEEETVEEIPVEVPTTPEGAPEEEEIPVDVPTTPEGAPEEEEDIDVEIPEIPEGDVLPQTGVAGAATFFGFGAAFIGLGAAVICKGIRREEI